MRVKWFHFHNHVDPWCQDNCDPDEEPELNDVNTEICKQLMKGLNKTRS